MKNNKKIYILIVILFVVGVIFIFLSSSIKENAKVIDYDKEYEKQDIKEYKYYFVSKYKDYKNVLEDNRDNLKIIGEELTEDKFNGSRYLLLFTKVYNCMDDVSYSNIKYENGRYKIYFNINHKCGYCAPDTNLYQIKVGASDTEKISIYYKTISDEKCDPDIVY